MTWETLTSLPTAEIRRCGRFVVADLAEAHRTISTSVRNGGQTESLRHLVNHQSCEGAGHDARFRVITDLGQESYHDSVCEELGLQASETAVMGTAANMNYAAIATEEDCRRQRHRHRHRRRADERDLRWRSGELARNAGGNRQSCGGRGHHQHDAAVEPSNDRRRVGPDRGHDDRGQELRASAPRRAQLLLHGACDRHGYRSVLCGGAVTRREAAHVGESAHEGRRADWAGRASRHRSKRCVGRTGWSPA